MTNPTSYKNPDGSGYTVYMGSNICHIQFAVYGLRRPEWMAKQMVQYLHEEEYDWAAAFEDVISRQVTVEKFMSHSSSLTHSNVHAAIRTIDPHTGGFKNSKIKLLKTLRSLWIESDVTTYEGCPLENYVMKYTRPWKVWTIDKIQAHYDQHFGWHDSPEFVLKEMSALTNRSRAELKHIIYPEAPLTARWTHGEICLHYDNNPNMTLTQLSAITNLSTASLKRILMGVK